MRILVVDDNVDLAEAIADRPAPLGGARELPLRVTRRKPTNTDELYVES